MSTKSSATGSSGSTASKRLSHAIHNKQACYQLRGSDFSDWVVTIAFYSALHFARHKVFPFTDRRSGNTFSTFDDYSRDALSRGDRRSRHSHMKNLVRMKVKSVSAAYQHMMDLSMTARYSDYETTRAQENLAIRLLNEIERACT